HRDRPSFPTRRSSDLAGQRGNTSLPSPFRLACHGTTNKRSSSDLSPTSCFRAVLLYRLLTFITQPKSATRRHTSDHCGPAPFGCAEVQDQTPWPDTSFTVLAL